jgi:hypothetical protein
MLVPFPPLAEQKRIVAKSNKYLPFAISWRDSSLHRGLKAAVCWRQFYTKLSMAFQSRQQSRFNGNFRFHQDRTQKTEVLQQR